MSERLGVRLEKFPRFGEEIVTEIPPQFSRISPVLGDLFVLFDYSPYLFNYMCNNAAK